MGYCLYGANFGHGAGALVLFVRALGRGDADCFVCERRVHELDVPAHTLLVDVLREHLGLTGTHVGCDTSQCGACTVHADGRAIKSCSLLAVQAQDTAITTIEGIGDAENLHPMQASFREHHGLQCGFCTPGMIMQAIDLVENNLELSNQSIRAGLKGNLCRCTGYHNIVWAVQAVADQRKAQGAAE